MSPPPSLVPLGHHPLPPRFTHPYRSTIFAKSGAAQDLGEIYNPWFVSPARARLPHALQLPCAIVAPPQAKAMAAQGVLHFAVLVLALSLGASILLNHLQRAELVHANEHRVTLSKHISAVEHVRDEVSAHWRMVHCQASTPPVSMLFSTPHRSLLVGFLIS